MALLKLSLYFNIWYVSYNLYYQSNSREEQIFKHKILTCLLYLSGVKGEKGRDYEELVHAVMEAEKSHDLCL